MLKINTYIYQLCGIMALLLGYMFSNTPDSLSDMYFNPNPKCQSVITKSDVSTDNKLAAPTKICSKNDSKHKSNVLKHISFEILMPQNSPFIIHPRMRVQHTCSLIKEYKYLYYTEINPPPPKVQETAKTGNT